MIDDFDDGWVHLERATYDEDFNRTVAADCGSRSRNVSGTPDCVTCPTCRAGFHRTVRPALRERTK